MKNVLKLVCVLLASLHLAGCGKEKYVLSDSVDNVAKIEILYVHSNADVFVEELQMMEPVIVIDETNHDLFLKEFLDLPCIRQGMDHVEAIAYNTVKITYTDGSVEWICHYDSLYYNAETEQRKWKHYYFNKEIWVAFVSQYLQNDSENPTG